MAKVDIDQVRAFIALAREEGVQELRYECQDIRMEVAFPVSASSVHSIVPPTSSGMASSRSIPAVALGHAVASPLVGTFYSAPAPGKAPFVKIGDRVRKGQVVCIIEAMKIMNEIESDKDGTITEMCVENESLVEFGQALFRIQI